MGKPSSDNAAGANVGIKNGKQQPLRRRKPPYCNWRTLLLLMGFLKLGDVRLNRRVMKMVRDCLPGAKCSLAALFGGGGPGDIKRAQELLSNDKAGILRLRSALYDTTAALIAERKIETVVCIYDPTLLDFSGQDFKKGRKSIGNGGGEGYVWLNSALVDPSSRRLLGVAHQALVSDKGPDDVGAVDYAPGVKGVELRRALAKNPKQQFLTHAGTVNERLASTAVSVIHVADREFDDGLALRSLLASTNPNSHFVIRGLGSRVVQVHAGDWWLPKHSWRSPRKGKPARPDAIGLIEVAVADIAEHLPLREYRAVPLDGRGRVCLSDQKRGVAHVAKLSIGATTVRIARRSARGRRAHIAEDAAWLNLVVVRETNPRRGKKPLLWLLLTDLPVAALGQAEQVADYYTCRWRIEEFFRTTKDAMKLEASELDDPEATARLLFFVTIKAMFLDDLRQRADIPAGTPPAPEQQRALVKGAIAADRLERRRQRGGNLPQFTSRERAVMALGKIARLGGWAARRGDNLGNYILLRGLPIFLHDVLEGRYAWLLSDGGDPGS